MNMTQTQPAARRITKPKVTAASANPAVPLPYLPTVPASDPAGLIDTAAVAALLAVSRRHVERLDSTGRLPRPIRLGRIVRWRRETILAFLAASERAGRMLNREEWDAFARSRRNDIEPATSRG